MVSQHQCTVLGLNRSVVSLVYHTQNQLSLTHCHCRVKSSRVHPKRIQIISVPDMTVQPVSPSNPYMLSSVPTPKTTSPTPKAVLIININIMLEADLKS